MISRILRSGVFFLCCLLMTTNSNSLVMMDVATNPEHKKELLQDLQRATGLWLDVRKDFIRELPFMMPWIPFAFFSSPDFSPTARYLLLGALQSETVYRVRTGADTRLGSSGSRIDLNFEQLKSVTYRDVPRQAFGAGIIFLHELAHSHAGLIDPNLSQGKENPDIKGPTVEFINRIQRELGLPPRLHYFPKKIAGKRDLFCIYFGNVERVELDAKIF